MSSSSKTRVASPRQNAGAAVRYHWLFFPMIAGTIVLLFLAGFEVPVLVPNQAPAGATLPGGYLPNSEHPAAASTVRGPTPQSTSPFWTNLTTSPSPPARVGAAMAYDAADGYELLFGGQGAVGYLGDTWAFAAGVWSNITSSAGPAPSPRTDASMTYDAADGFVFLVGGYGAGANCSLQCNDSWKFTGGHWSKLPTPWSYGLQYVNQLDIEAAYDSTDGYVLVEQVALAGATQGTSWSYKGGVWTDLSYNSTTNRTMASANFEYATMFDDPALKGVVLFGGWEFPVINSVLVSNQTWLFSNGAWVNETTNASGVPPARFFSSSAFDPTTSSAVVFGGYTLRGQYYSVRGDTWTLSGLNWTNATPLVAPPAAGLAAMGWDGADNTSLLFGGGNDLEVPTAYTWGWSSNPPVASLHLMASPSPVDVGVPTRFNATVIGGTSPFSYNWSLGDGTGSNAVAPSHAYSSNGSFNVTLVLTDAASHVAIATLGVSVVNAITIVGRTGLAVGDARSPVSFGVKVTGGSPPFSYAWTFGDGSSSSLSSTSHTYSSAGSYSVRVWVNDTGGGSANATWNEAIAAPLGTPVISATPSSAALGQLVNFTANETGGTAPYSYSWEFGDGGTGGNLRNISHIFTTNGPFTASVSVTDAAGVSSVGYLNMTIALNLTILANWTAGAAPLAVGFTSHTSGGTPGYTYLWQFGDGSTSAVASPDHLYTSPGYYTSQVTVRDSDGHSAVATWTVFVASGGGGPLKVSLTAEPSTISAGASSLATGSITGGSGGYTLTWSPDGLSCAPAGFVSERCTSPSGGPYRLTLAVTDQAGHSATATVSSQPGVGTTPHPGFDFLTYPGVLVPITAGAVLVAAGLAVAVTRSRTPSGPTSPDPRFAEFREAIRPSGPGRSSTAPKGSDGRGSAGAPEGESPASTEVDSLSDLR